MGHGKVILLGEHAVVYGHSALAAAIDRKVVARVTAADRCRLIVPAWSIDVWEEDDHPVARALGALRRAAGAEPAHIHCETELPVATGLGSSAALSVAIARALRPDASSEELAAIAHEGERCFHNQPSGIDVALAIHGGIGHFTRSEGFRPIECPAFDLVIGLSGKTRNTRALVEKVRAAVDAEPARADDLAAMGAIAERGELALTQADDALFGELMNECQHLLASFELSCSELDEMVEVSLAAGALGAKLTGAGGGGAMIALAPGNEDAVIDAIRDRGYDAFVTRVGTNEDRT